MLNIKNCFSLNYYYSNLNFFFFFNGLYRKFYKIPGHFTSIIYYRPFNRFCISLNLYLKYEVFSFLTAYKKVINSFNSYFLNSKSFNLYVYFLSLDDIFMNSPEKIFFYSSRSYFLNSFNFFRNYFFSRVFFSLFFFNRSNFFSGFSKSKFYSLLKEFNNLFFFKINYYYLFYVNFFFNFLSFRFFKFYFFLYSFIFMLLGNILGLLYFNFYLILSFFIFL